VSDALQLIREADAQAQRAMSTANAFRMLLGVLALGDGGELRISKSQINKLKDHEIDVRQLKTGGFVVKTTKIPKE
jgi:hypothetical protein